MKNFFQYITGIYRFSQKKCLASMRWAHLISLMKSVDVCYKAYADSTLWVKFVKLSRTNKLSSTKYKENGFKKN